MKACCQQITSNVASLDYKFQKCPKLANDTSHPNASFSLMMSMLTRKRLLMHFRRMRDQSCSPYWREMIYKTGIQVISRVISQNTPNRLCERVFQTLISSMSEINFWSVQQWMSVLCHNESEDGRLHRTHHRKSCVEISNQASHVSLAVLMGVHIPRNMNGQLNMEIDIGPKILSCKVAVCYAVTLSIQASPMGLRRSEPFHNLHIHLLSCEQ